MHPVGGFNVCPAEVENTLLAHDAIAMAMDSMAQPSPRSG